MPALPKHGCPSLLLRSFAVGLGVPLLAHTAEHFGCGTGWLGTADGLRRNLPCKGDGAAAGTAAMCHQGSEGKRTSGELGWAGASGDPWVQPRPSRVSWSGTARQA